MTLRRHVPPPSARDVCLAAEALAWPLIRMGGRGIEGEKMWRVAIETADWGDGTWALWRALQMRPSKAEETRSRAGPGNRSAPLSHTGREAGDSRARGLIESPPGTPLPGQNRLVGRAIEVSRSYLRLPGRIVVFWRNADRDACAGACALEEDGISDIYLNENACLVRTTLHELAHLSDFHTGAWRDLFGEEMEKRAVGFAGRMMTDPGVLRLLAG